MVLSVTAVTFRVFILGLFRGDAVKTYNIDSDLGVETMDRQMSNVMLIERKRKNGP
jgi:hypothetical protein